MGALYPQLYLFAGWGRHTRRSRLIFKPADIKQVGLKEPQLSGPKGLPTP